MIGLARDAVAVSSAVIWIPDSGEVPTDGPFGVLRPDRRMCGVDREAAFASAFARSGSCMSVVRRDRLEVRFGRESTR